MTEVENYKIVNTALLPSINVICFLINRNALFNNAVSFCFCRYQCHFCVMFYLRLAMLNLFEVGYLSIMITKIYFNKSFCVC